MMYRNEMLKKLQKYWPVPFVILYVVLNVFLIMHHENWRDEAQAWQIAKNVDFAGLFAQLKYEGHPFLWYLILMPFAKLGLPFGIMNYISLVFMTAAVWLLLKKAPFFWPVKLILIFSSFYVYYYPVISRSYCMIPLLLSVIAILYPRRRELGIWYGMALAFLTQTHVYMIGLSFLLSCFWLGETVCAVWRDKSDKGKSSSLYHALAGLGLSFASGLFFLWELAGSTEMNTSIDIHISSSFSYNLYRNSVGAQWAVDNALGIGLSEQAWKLTLVGICICVVFLFWYSWKEALILAGTFLTQVLMFTYVYLSSEQKAMILIHELIFILWLILDKNRKTAWKRWHMQRIAWQAILTFLSVIAINGHFQKIVRDVREPYSAGKAAADYIINSVPEEEIVVTASDLAAFSVAAYLSEREIWYPVTEEQVSFSVWNEERLEAIDYEEMLERVKEKYPEAAGIYLICGTTSNYIAGLEEYIPVMKEVFRQEAMLPEESVTLYYLEL